MKTKYLLSTLLMLMLVLSLSACGGDGGGNTASETPTKVFGPRNNVVPEFIFDNTGPEDICELYFSPVDAQTWGPDQLQGQTIPAGKTFTLRNIPSGLYDARAVSCNNGEQVFQVEIQNP